MVLPLRLPGNVGPLLMMMMMRPYVMMTGAVIIAAIADGLPIHLSV